MKIVLQLVDPILLENVCYATDGVKAEWWKKLT